MAGNGDTLLSRDSNLKTILFSSASPYLAVLHSFNTLNANPAASSLAKM